MSESIPEKTIKIKRFQYLAVPMDIIENFNELKGAKLMILELIVRKTLGFRKFQDYISNSQFQNETGYSPSEIINTLNQLKELSYIEWHYLCPKCKNEITNYTCQKSNRNYQCQNCQTKEPPNKYYNLIMSEEAKQGYLSMWGSIESILPSKDSILPLIDNLEKGSIENRVGSIESSEGVVKKVDYCSIESRYTIKDNSINDLNNKKDIYISDSSNENLDNEPSAKSGDDKIAVQTHKIKKAITDKYKLSAFQQNYPSYQFIRDLIVLHADKGGFDYVIRKVNELPVPCEYKQIGQTLRAWCNNPDYNAKNKGNGGNGKTLHESNNERLRQIESVRAIWNEDATLQSRIAKKKYTEKDAILLALTRVAELNNATLDAIYKSFESECLFYNISEEELNQFRISE